MASKNVMDISIKSWYNVLKKENVFKKFLESKMIVEEKVDGCLDKDTIIETKEFGFIPISKIVDENLKCSVRGYDTEKQELVWNEVQKVLNSGKADNWVEIELEDKRTIKITDNHWVWSETEKTYKQVKNLYEDEEFLIKDLKPIKIKKISKIENDSDRYDLELNGTKNFFSNGILVHNTKLQLFLKEDANNNKSVDKNWIVSYKGNVLYSTEFGHNTPEESKQSIGSSQFRFVFDVLKNINVDEIPKGYQYFCEYLIDKPTLMSQYSKKYVLILLSYGPSKCQVKNGILKCDNSKFSYDFNERKELAQKMGIYYPPVIANGYIYPTENLFRYCNDKVKKELTPYMAELKNTENDYELYFKSLSNLLIDVESEFGGEVEGYVFNGCDKCPIKVQKPTQLDKEERAKLKAQYREDSLLKEAEYWANVKKIAKDILSKIKNKTIEGKLSEASKILTKYNIENLHSKKNAATIKDDIMLTIKMEIIRDLADKYALVQGKFRVFTKAHKQLIDKALRENDGVVIAIISGRKTPKAVKELKRKVIETCYAKEIVNGRVDIVEATTGNINTILNKTVNVVTKLYAGSDRIKGYEELLNKSGRDIKVVELPRDDSGISSTKIIQNLDDINYFRENTAKCTWKFYKEYERLRDKLDIF